MRNLEGDLARGVAGTPGSGQNTGKWPGRRGNTQACVQDDLEVLQGTGTLQGLGAQCEPQTSSI